VSDPTADTPPVPGEGHQAPTIALPDEYGTLHRLADRLGHWTIVYFYPQDDTPGCTTESCQFRDLHDLIVAEGGAVWGISPDGPASHAHFKGKFELPFTLLSDVDHGVAERYGAWVLKENYGRTYMGVQRSSFLVDPAGRIARAWPKVKADGHAAEVLAALAEAKRLAKSG